MKKSLLLGSTAALIAVSGAHAADLPVVEPVDYVKVCDAFGAGFHYIPGTETCLKFSGRIRVERGIGDDDDNDDKDDKSFMNSDFELVVNASSMTEIGLLIGQFAISGSNEGAVELGDAWITIGQNILVGRETSRFDFGGGYGIYEGLYVDAGVNQFTFIMPFGNGVSLTLGLEDGRNRQGFVAEGNTANGVFTNYTDVGSSSNIGGMEIPDFVASLRVSQGWGSAQVSGALHHLRPSANDNNGVITDEGFGWAVQAGAEVNVGTMTKVKLVGGYADGALAYIGGSQFVEVTVNDDGAPDPSSFSGEIMETHTGWYVLAALSHDFSYALNLGVTGSFHDFDDQAELWQIGATLEYEVVENLLVSIAAKYESVEFDNTDLANTLVSHATAVGDGDSWEALLRVQRNF